MNLRKIGMLLLVLVPGAVFAQTPEMADGMRADGKIYVVVSIILTVLAGLIAYLFLIDKKVKKLEKLISEKGK